MEKLKNITIILSLIGGLTAFGTVLGGLVSAVVFWQELQRVIDTVNETDVRYYHETLKPRVEELWKNKHH